MNVYYWNLYTGEHTGGFHCIVHAFTEAKAWELLYQLNKSAWFEAHNNQGNPIGYCQPDTLYEYFKQQGIYKTALSIDPEIITGNKAIVIYEGE